MPVTNGDIRIRLSTEQRQEIKRRAEACGKNISTFVREKSLEDDLELYLMVKRIYESLGLQNAYKNFKEEQPGNNIIKRMRLRP